MPAFFVGALALAWLHPAGVDGFMALVARGQLGPPCPLVIRHARLEGRSAGEPAALIDLRIERGSIVSLDRAGTIAPRAGDQVIEAEGRALTLGLVDAHTAAVFRDPLRRVLPPVVARDALRAQVRAGVTSVRDLGSPAHAVHRLAAATGERLWGPSIEVGGPWLTLGGANGAPGDPYRHPSQRRTIRTVEEVVHAVAEVAQAGGQWLAVDPPVGVAAADAHALLDAVARSAHASRLKLAVRVLDDAQLRWALEVGAGSLEELARHSNELTADVVAQIAASGAVVVPLAHLTRVAEVGSNGGYERDRQTRWIGRAAWWGELAWLDREIRARHASPEARAADRARVERFRENLARLAAAGVPIAMGTGAPRPFAFSERPIDEVEALASAGLVGPALLEACTAGGRRLLGGARTAARIEIGAPADLVLWDCNPTAETRCFERPRWVIVAGRVVDGRTGTPARPFL